MKFCRQIFKVGLSELYAPLSYSSYSAALHKMLGE
jgi:hypothetical protein